MSRVVITFNNNRDFIFLIYPAQKSIPLYSTSGNIANLIKFSYIDKSDPQFGVPEFKNILFFTKMFPNRDIDKSDPQFGVPEFKIF